MFTKGAPTSLYQTTKGAPEMLVDQDQVADPPCPFEIIDDDSALLIFNKCNFNDQCALKLALKRVCFKSISVHDFMRDHTQCTVASIVALAVMNERQDVIDALQNNYGEVSKFKECLSKANVHNLKGKNNSESISQIQKMHEDEIINSTWTPDASFLVSQIEKAGGLTDSEFKHLSFWLPSEMPKLPANPPQELLRRMQTIKIKEAKTQFLISLVDALLLTQRVNILRIAMKFILQYGPYIESSTWKTLQLRYFATAIWMSYEKAVHPCLRHEILTATATEFSFFDTFDTEAYNEVVNFFIFLMERHFKKLPLTNDSLELKQRSAGIQSWIRRCFVTEYIFIEWMKSSGSPIDGINKWEREAFFLRVAKMGFLHGCVDAFIEKRMHEVWKEGGAFGTDAVKARENEFENEFTYMPQFEEMLHAGPGGGVFNWINFKAYAWAVHSILLRNHPSTWPNDSLSFMLRHSSNDEDGLIKVVEKAKRKESIFLDFPTVASTAFEIAAQPTLSVLARSKLLKAIEGLSLQELKPFGLTQNVATTKRQVASLALMSGDQALLSWAKERGISQHDYTDAIQSNIQVLALLIEGVSGDRIVASALYNADSNRHERVKPIYYVDEVDFAVKWEDVATFALRAGTRSLPLVFSYALDNHLYIQQHMLEGAHSWTTLEMLIKHFRIPASMFRLGHITSHLKCSTERAALRRLIPTLAATCSFGDEWDLARNLATSGFFDLSKLFLSKVERVVFPR